MGRGAFILLHVVVLQARFAASIKSLGRSQDHLSVGRCACACNCRGLCAAMCAAAVRSVTAPQELAVRASCIGFCVQGHGKLRYLWVQLQSGSDGRGPCKCTCCVTSPARSVLARSWQLNAEQQPRTPFTESK